MNPRIGFSVCAALVVVGLGSLLDATACSPSGGTGDASVEAGPTCDPDSGDPQAGCPCTPSTYKTSDCYTGPPGTNAKGICQTGKRSCTAEGTLTNCVGEVTPQPETCNYTDDDCNGIADDLPEIADAAIIAKCNSPACDPDFTDAAITCWGPDPGICGAGVKSCTSGPKGGSPSGCEEFIHGGVPEVCNGLDDDCNGSIDDGLDTEGPCDLDDGATWPADANPFDGSITKILGQCVHGNMTCVATNCSEHSCADAGDVCFPTQPTTETCNGIDDNCNGQVDEKTCLLGGPYCCGYVSGGKNYGFCTSFYEGDGGSGQFYNCHTAN